MSFALLQGGRLVAGRGIITARSNSCYQRHLSASTARSGKNPRNVQQQQQERAPALPSTPSSSSHSTPSPEPLGSSDIPETKTSDPPLTPNMRALPSLDFTAGATAAVPALGAGNSADQPTGARPSRESLSTIERKRRFLGRLSLTLLGLGLVGAWVYMGREWEQGEDVPQGGQEMGRIARANARLRAATDVFDKPAWKQLLPPPLPAPHQRPYTLLISMDDLLTASSWDRENGWRTMKRPGLEYFIGYLSQFYEIVVFTSQYAYSAIPVLEQVDPYTLYISYKLFRESTRSIDGKIVKDLSYLNRDLSKVVAIDTNPEHLALHPENAVIVQKWKGDKETRAGLVNLIPFLESIAIHRPDDVRPILRAYKGKDVALEYAKFEAEMKQKQIEQWEKSGGGKSVMSNAAGGSWLSRLMGAPSNATPTTSKDGTPLTYLEQKRLEAQENYKAEVAYFKSQEPMFKKYIEEEREKQAKEMSGSLFGMLSGQSGPLAMITKLEADKEKASLLGAEQEPQQAKGNKV